MSLELYLINAEPSSKKGYELYSNSSKKGIEAIIEKEAIKTANEGLFSKIKYGLKIFAKKNYEFVEKYTSKILRRLQNPNLHALKSASLVSGVTVNYSPEITEQQARKIYKKIANREYNKNAAILALDTIIGAAITPICYIPPLTFIPATSLPFILVWIHCFKNLRNISKGAKGANFKKNYQVELVEKAIREPEKAEIYKESIINPDLKEYCGRIK